MNKFLASQTFILQVLRANLDDKIVSAFKYFAKYQNEPRNHIRQSYSNFGRMKTALKQATSREYLF